MIKNKFVKIPLINLSLFLFLFFISDLIISTINLKRNLLFPTLPKFGIPRQMCSSKTIYDASSLYSDNKTHLISYKRDKECYRSKNKINENKIVLTIGGSTTDQRFINEGETFQDLLDVYFNGKYDFINGGVDGQSSIGHLFSIKNWHSKALKDINQQVSDVIYYIGINDLGLTYLNESELNKQVKLSRIIKDYLVNNSYIYSQIKNIYFSKSLPKTFGILAAHGKKFVPLEIPKKGEVSIKILDINGYSNLINDLLKATKESFPNTRIHIVQQQVPACKFENSNIFYDRHPNEFKDICKNIGQVYLSINHAVNKSKYSQFTTIYPMYLESPIEDKGFYDFAHTNNLGSMQIAQYLYRELKLN